MVSLRKNFFRCNAWSLLQYVGNEHPPLRTPQNLTTPDGLVDENSASSLTVPKQKPTAFLQHFKRSFFSSSRMSANTPRYSRHDVRYRRVNLKTIDPCDLVDEENLRRRHDVDSSHFNMNDPFLCWRHRFLLWSWHPTPGVWSSLANPGGTLPKTQLFFFGDSVGGYISLLHVFMIWARNVTLGKRAHLHKMLYSLLFPFFCT
jgi:hypothetical protein